MTIPNLTHTLLAQPVFWSGAHLSSSHLQGCPTGKTSNKNIQVLITNKQHCKHQPNSCLFPPPPVPKGSFKSMPQTAEGQRWIPQEPLSVPKHGDGGEEMLVCASQCAGSGAGPSFSHPTDWECRTAWFGSSRGRSSSWLFGARREGWRWGSTEHRCSQREKVSSLTSRAF